MAKRPAYDSIRSFGRTYTQAFGLLSQNAYRRDLSLLQSRLIFEIQQAEEILASDLVELLKLDKGYLSRSISKLVSMNVILSRPNPGDRREKFLSLSHKGKALFAEIDKVSRDRSTEFSKKLGESRARALSSHLASAELLMGDTSLKKEEILLRGLAPGDIGWVIGRHGEIYSSEYGWNIDFETLVGEIAIAFVANSTSTSERAWIAEARGVRLGCVFLVKESASTAKLRILLVDPSARGLGLGTRLVGECIRFAKKSGYRKLTLWTNSVLTSARKIYQAEGFQLIKEEPHQSFGKKLVGQYWELPLDS